MTRIELPREKKVGHLTLLRQQRSLTSKEFNALTADERLEIIRHAQGMNKYNLMLEAADVAELVPRLAAQEVYLLIKEMGSEDVTELLDLISTDQLTTILDLDCWEGDTLQAPPALVWMQYLLDGGEERVIRAIKELDFLLLVLMFKKFVTVPRGPESYDDDDELMEAMVAAGGYELEFHDPESSKVVSAVLDIVFRHEREEFTRLMECVRWEQEAMLEEEVYGQRVGRLQDHGFPDPFEAQRVYARLDPSSFAVEDHRKKGLGLVSEEGAAPGFILTVARPRDLLAEVLAGGLKPETAWELTFLLNKVMSADKVDVGDLAAVQTAMEEVYRYLNLALEELSEGDVVRAAACFDDVYLESLFRLGFSLTLELQQRALRLRNSPAVTYLDGPFRALLDGLMRKKPRLFEGVLEENRGGERPFATLRDLRLAGEWLERLELQLQLFAGHFPFELPLPASLDLSGCYPEDAGDLTLSDFFLTALANRLQGRDFLPEPFPQGELGALHDRVCRDGLIAEELRRETGQWLESLLPGTGPFADYCLDLWAEDFCTRSAAEVDPRYLGGLIVRRSQSSGT